MKITCTDLERIWLIGSMLAFPVCCLQGRVNACDDNFCIDCLQDSIEWTITKTSCFTCKHFQEEICSNPESTHHGEEVDPLMFVCPVYEEEVKRIHQICESNSTYSIYMQE